MYLLSDIIDLVYPRICAACNDEQPVRGGIFCVDCLAELPMTDYHEIRDNPFERHFWGRVDIVAGGAFLYFVPGGRTQTLLHNIKYCGRSTYAEGVGEFYGHKLARTDRFDGVECIVPVPLHWRKLNERGFNQSASFGKGLARALGIPQHTSVLLRTRATPTQTRKSRQERISNMKDAFVVRRPDRLAGKHVLLIDDVLTTGATLEACALKILEVPGVTLSMATIACGRL